MQNKMLVSASVAALLLGGANFASAQDTAEVSTKYGPVIGHAQNGVLAFKGVRYGADTGGENRFARPQEPAAWTEALDAASYGNRCVGQDYSPALMPEEGADLDTSPASEDCLFLNVWTPGTDANAKRPVMVWLHGGGYTSGSGGSIRYDGENLARGQDVVLVTLNHRLGALGFMDLSGIEGAPEDSENVGMLDIVQALKWVQDNIANFGGDPANVTVFGESGGGGKATTLLGMPEAKGLVHRVIAQSGANIRPITAENAAKNAAQFREATGAQTLADLRAIPAEQIGASAGNWGPVLGGALAAAPFSAEAWGADVPLMIGSTLTEATFFNATPKEGLDEAGLAGFLTENNFTALDPAKVDEVVAVYKSSFPEADPVLLAQIMASDGWMTNTVRTVADLRAEAGHPAWVYLFAEPQKSRAGLNVPHTSEIAYVFDNLDLSKAIVGEPAESDRSLAKTMSAAWANFARNGVPSADGLADWPAYTAETRAVMEFKAEPALLQDPYTARLDALTGARKK